MPGKSFYEGLTLPEQILKLREHHHAPPNRHISAYEDQLLADAARLAARG